MLEKDKTLIAQINRYLSEFTFPRRHGFDRRMFQIFGLFSFFSDVLEKEEAEFIKTIQKEDLLDFYHTFIHPSAPERFVNSFAYLGNSWFDNQDPSSSLKFMPLALMINLRIKLEKQIRKLYRMMRKTPSRKVIKNLNTLRQKLFLLKTFGNFIGPWIPT